MKKMIKKISSVNHMQEFGARIGILLRGGEVIELVGDVGAGKTTLVKGIARGLEVAEDIQSPTFTISRTYKARDGLRLSHYDFYRLSDPGILKMELSEMMGSSSDIVIIEWAETVKSTLPSDRLSIEIIPDSETSTAREVKLAATGASSSKLLEGLF